MKVGDRVKVVDEGLNYSTYEDMADIMNLREFGWRRGNRGFSGMTGKVLRKEKHRNVSSHIVCGVTTEDGHVFMIGEEGLEKIDPTPIQNISKNYNI